MRWASSVRERVTTLTRQGSVAPIKIVGSANVAKERTTMSGSRAGESRLSIGDSQPAQVDQCDRKAVTAKETSARLSSRNPYALSGRATASATRPPSALPMDRPKKKLATVTLTDSVVLPSTNCNCLNQMTCRMRDAAPDAKKIAVTAALTMAPTAAGLSPAIAVARTEPWRIPLHPVCPGLSKACL